MVATAVFGKPCPSGEGSKEFLRDDRRDPRVAILGRRDVLGYSWQGISAVIFLPSRLIKTTLEDGFIQSTLCQVESGS
jgi:hypothetical protein